MVEVMDRSEAEVPYRVKRELAGELYHQVVILVFILEKVERKVNILKGVCGTLLVFWEHA